LTFALGRHVRVIELIAIGDRRGSAEEARSLYRDLAPPAPETAMPKDMPF
jgi:ribosome-associated heat shock protein Hsp15